MILMQIENASIHLNRELLFRGFNGIDEDVSYGRLVDKLKECLPEAGYNHVAIIESDCGMFFRLTLSRYDVLYKHDIEAETIRFYSVVSGIINNTTLWLVPVLNSSG